MSHSMKFQQPHFSKCSTAKVAQPQNQLDFTKPELRASDKYYYFPGDIRYTLLLGHLQKGTLPGQGTAALLCSTVSYKWSKWSSGCDTPCWPPFLQGPQDRDRCCRPHSEYQSAWENRILEFLINAHCWHYSLEKVRSAVELVLPREALLAERALAVGTFDTHHVPRLVQHLHQKPLHDGLLTARTDERGHGYDRRALWG